VSFLNHLYLGFETALSLQNLLYAFLGCLMGTAIGVLPGLGPLATISMLIPFTFGLDPTAALIMLSGIYYGAAYGGSTTAILINLPGETSSVVTVIDGYQMARKGRAGVAIATAGIGSFFAGCVATLVLALFAVPLSMVAIRFGPTEYFSLMVLGLIGSVSLSSGSVLNALGMIVIGVILGTVGTDLNSGVQRFTFGSQHLWEGIEFIVIAVGIFAVGEILTSLSAREGGDVYTRDVGRLMPNREDFRRMTPAILRGTGIGSLIGVLPGAGQTLAAYFAYALERKVSAHRHEMGTGAIEGVAAPESANNAAAQTAFIPTLTLGIPGSATMALILGAMIMHNVQPGPSVITRNPELFWGLIASMWIGNLFLVILNLPLVGIWVKLLEIPYRFLFPAVLVFCAVAVYSVRFSEFDIYMATGFAIFGYGLVKLNLQPAPLMLGVVLGQLLEENFKRAMILSGGDFTTFVREPISLSFLIVAALLLIFACLPSIRKNRDILVEDP
jgi:putative tricarboxylic transport membrane protein